MTYLVTTNNQQHGPFTIEEINLKLKRGEIASDDLAWAEGWPDWLPLSDIPEVKASSSLNPPLPPSDYKRSKDSSNYTSPPPIKNSSSSSSAVLASRGSRLGACSLDCLAGAICYIPVIIASSSSNEVLTGVAVIVSVVLYLSFAGVQICMLSKRGQTIGKYGVGIKIVNMVNGGNPGFVKAFLLRGFVAVLPVVSVVDACMIFRDDRRCLHDLIAGTKVIKT